MTGLVFTSQGPPAGPDVGPACPGTPGCRDQASEKMSLQKSWSEQHLPAPHTGASQGLPPAFRKPQERARPGSEPSPRLVPAAGAGLGSGLAFPTEKTGAVITSILTRVKEARGGRSNDNKHPDKGQRGMRRQALGARQSLPSAAPAWRPRLSLGDSHPGTGEACRCRGAGGVVRGGRPGHLEHQFPGLGFCPLPSCDENPSKGVTRMRSVPWSSPHDTRPQTPPRSSRSAPPCSSLL